MDHLSFSYGGGPVLRDVSFCMQEGEFLSVLGPNGVGKSTLFRCMLGQLAPQSGSVTVQGKRIEAIPPRNRARLIAYIPQSHNPVFNFTVRDMVLMGTTAQTGVFSVPGAEQEALAEKTLRQLGIAHLAGCGYASISGGERQLVLIARAIAQQAHILVMDEPTANLDLGNRIRVLQAVRALAQQGYGVIQSTHDPEQAYRYSDRVLALYEGRVLALGTPQSVIDGPLISKLYGEEIQVCSLRDDTVRVCVPAAGCEERKEKPTCENNV